MILELLMVGVMGQPPSLDEFRLLQAIATVESGGNSKAVNRQTWDYGLLQINHRTANQYGKFAFQMFSTQQSAEIALKVLKEHKKRFGHEPMWVCRYNQGTAVNVPKRNGCRKYFYKLLKAGYVSTTRLKEAK